MKGRPSIAAAFVLVVVCMAVCVVAIWGLKDSLLVKAARDNQLWTVRLLLRAGADPDACNEVGMTALYWAGSNGNVPMVRVMLEHGADMARIGNTGLPPIFGATMRVKEVYLDAGFDLNRGWDGGRTILMGASAAGLTNEIALLILRGAKVNQREKIEGFTALMMAARNGQSRAAKTLVQHGADVSMKDFQGHDAAWYALDREYTNLAQTLASCITSQPPEAAFQ